MSDETYNIYDEWNGFVIEGEKLYNYLINNFDSMFDGDTITHFNIREGIYWGIDDTNEIFRKYGDDIQMYLLPWIKEELKENRLFDKTLWKPFRDQYTIFDMYYGYRKLFRYKHYIFQLAIESSCSLRECKICDLTTDEYCLLNSKHFELALYGWKEENSDIMQPKKNFKIPEDNIMCLKHWSWK